MCSAIYIPIKQKDLTINLPRIFYKKRQKLSKVRTNKELQFAVSTETFNRHQAQETTVIKSWQSLTEIFESAFTFSKNKFHNKAPYYFVLIAALSFYNFACSENNYDACLK